MESPNLGSLVTLHPEVMDISFRHFSTITNVFKKNVCPILGIDYFSLMIIDSNQVLTFYSNRPSLEFNLIQQELWRYDGIYNTKNHLDGAFYFWDELYSDGMKTTLTNLKENKLGCAFGFYLMKKMDDVFVIYSFATQRQECKNVYLESKNILYKIGDYFFYDLKPVHKSYLSQENNTLKKSLKHLKLVVNNT